MSSYNIRDLALENLEYRKILETHDDFQLVLMTLQPRSTSVHSEIPEETHDTTQFLYCEKGAGLAFVDSKVFALTDGCCVVIPAHTLHRIVNVSSETLHLYTIYCSPEH